MAIKSENRWRDLQQRILACRRCPRLVEHCQQVGQSKRAAYREENYWSQPVVNFGTAPARLLIVGLAPGAHGANRTGRMFTGDRSGQWLYRALHRAEFSNQATWENRLDGLELRDCVITAAAHCAPPGNRPSIQELANCRPFLEETLRQTNPIVIVVLGQIAWQETKRVLTLLGHSMSSKLRFGHGAETEWTPGRWLVASYHPSQQNTFTGKLTESMLDKVFSRARELIPKS
ncbi:MAG TPA: uracil-DNA glycosylase [Pirellulaceae bacterium]|nr:uracil-DNA glycosylase [Pirellulaceae bacterium]